MGFSLCHHSHPGLNHLPSHLLLHLPLSLSPHPRGKLTIHSSCLASHHPKANCCWTARTLAMTIAGAAQSPLTLLQQRIGLPGTLCTGSEGNDRYTSCKMYRYIPHASVSACSVCPPSLFWAARWWKNASAKLLDNLR